ncbi:MAG: hypothetical protein LBI63_05155 [Candidatus Ancillula sp.]|jgi:hypothetical protein|nr:hypothetical protein [Candidatus Ancillula sp.]
MVKKLIRNSIASLAVAGLVATSGVAFANAAQPGNYLYDGVNIRQNGNVSSTVLGMGYKVDGLMAICAAQGGSAINGNTNWIRHTNNKSSVNGYSTEEYVTWVGGITKGSGAVCNG